MADDETQGSIDTSWGAADASLDPRRPSMGFDEFLVWPESPDWADIAGQTSWSGERFTSKVYQQEMSGKPRMDGALAALEYFEVPDAAERVAAYAEKKQTMVIKLIEAGEFKAYPDALRFVLAVRAAGIPAIHDGSPAPRRWSASLTQFQHFCMFAELVWPG